MKIQKLFWRDMRVGTFCHWVRFLIVPVVVILVTSAMPDLTARLYDAGTISGSGTAADYYLYVMQGMYIYKFSPDSVFIIPISWFMLHIGVSYLTAYYPHKDYQEFGTTVLLTAKSRTKWWFGKVLWCAASVAVYYLLIVLSCIAAAAICGADLTDRMSTDLSVYLYGDGIQYVSKGDLYLIALVLPYLISVMLCEFQMLLGFLLTPVVSFAVTCGIYILSAYYTCWWLVANFTMWRRSTYVEYEGIHPGSGIAIAVCGIACIVMSGILYFRSRDILE